MQPSYQTLLVFMAFQSSAVLASPAADRPPPRPPPRYQITSQQVKDGTPFNPGLSVLAGRSKLVASVFDSLHKANADALTAVGIQEQ